MTDGNLEKPLPDLARDAWDRYLDVIDPLRPDLFRYCRRLTGSVWDAEDLVQDALEQGFARLGLTPNEQGIDNPRGYVLRIASNLWISRQRRERLARATASGPDAGRLDPGAAPPPESTTEVREAGATLLQQLAPQERAAVLLKETFDLTLEEIADLLGTTVGAVKAALHRGRERLREAEDEQAPPRHPVSKAVIDLFVERYNARDMQGMLALMLDTAAIEMTGNQQYIGRKVYGRERGWFYYNFFNPFDGKPASASWETVLLHGEPVVLVLNPRDGELCVTSVMRLETDEQHVSRIRVYAMCPDSVREVAAAFGRPCGTMGFYRLPREVLARIATAQRNETP